jgi:hypothetical protein
MGQVPLGFRYRQRSTCGPSRSTRTVAAPWNDLIGVTSRCLGLMTAREPAKHQSERDEGEPSTDDQHKIKTCERQIAARDRRIRSPLAHHSFYAAAGAACDIVLNGAALRATVAFDDRPIRKRGRRKGEQRETGSEHYAQLRHEYPPEVDGIHMPTVVPYSGSVNLPQTACRRDQPLVRRQLLELFA